MTGGSVVKNPHANAGDAGDLGSVPGWGRAPGGENGNPLQYSCLKNPMDRGPWQATVQGDRKELDMTEQLSTHTHTHTQLLTKVFGAFEAKIMSSAQVIESGC